MAEKVYNRLKIRFAEKKDIKRIGELLEQVNRIHHDIRPDLFRLGRKYSERELFMRICSIEGSISRCGA